MRSRLIAALLPAATVAVLIGAWHVYVRAAGVSPFVLPAPGAVWSAGVELVGQERTWMHAWVTVREILGGFALAIVTGTVTGFVLGSSRVLERAFSPVLVLLQVVPKVALIPLFVLWFGFGLSTKVLVAAIFAFFPLAAGTIAGVRSVSPLHRDLGAVVHIGRRQRFWVIDLPSALPSIVTGMEVAIVLATVGAIVAEYLAGSEGLGWLAVTALNQLQVDTLFAVVALLSLIGFALYRAVAALRRVLVPWHPSAREETVRRAW